MSDYDECALCNEFSQALAAERAKVERLKGLLKPFADAAMYGQRYLDERLSRQLPNNFATAVDRSAEQTGWSVWEAAQAALKDGT